MMGSLFTVNRRRLCSLTVKHTFVNITNNYVASICA